MGHGPRRSHRCLVSNDGHVLYLHLNMQKIGDAVEPNPGKVEWFVDNPSNRNLRLTTGPGRGVPVLGMGHPVGLLQGPDPSHIIQCKPRAHPSPSFGFPVPSHPNHGTGTGWEVPATHNA